MTQINFKFKTIDEKSEKIKVSDNAREIFLRRYVLKNSEGKPAETIEQAIYRVASHVADAEETAELKKYYTDLYNQMILNKRFIPNTPTWSGAKTKLGQLAACFVLPIIDDMGKERGGIFDTLKDATLIQQTGGGIGVAFSDLRPKGDRISASNGIASGPISFLRAYDMAFGQVAQGGTRRGANMGVLKVDHPDIFEFIRCKAVEGSIANFNISVGITDKFMEAVKSNSDFDLINPRDGKVWKTIKARELFDEIVKYAYKNGEPGVLFLDAANRQNPVPNQYVLKATNPCGEQYLGPYENCCLGHVNINASVKDGQIDWEHLKETTILGTRFLDDIVTMNAYVPMVPELKQMAHKNRRIGLGFLGLADAMYQMGIRYGSDESLEFASQVTEFIRYFSMLTSIELAKEKGAFPGIKKSVYDPESFTWEIPKPLVAHTNRFGRPDLNWHTVSDAIKDNGIRNSTQMTVAPTGTTSTVFDVEGYGCEVNFALAYYRNVYQSAGGAENLTLRYVSPSFQIALDKSDISDELKEKIIEEAIVKGTIQHLKDIPEKIKDVFVVSADISAKDHVMMQAAIQRFVDNSISKTCNFPENATIEDVKNAYFMAWELGCKGLTVYVTGSRQEVVLETEETKRKKTQKEISEVLPVKRNRPAVIIGRTHEISTPFGKAFVTVNRNGENGTAPFEVFITIGKSGTDSAAFAEALGRLISGWLRSASDPDIALEEIASQLKGIGGSFSVGFGKNRVSSIPDAVAKVLYEELSLSKQIGITSKQMQLDEPEEEIKAATSSVFKNASVCPDCKNLTLIESEGCVKCMTCAYSRC